MLVWPRFPFVRLLWVYKCVRVFSYITFSCQLLECLKFDKAQVLLKTEWLSKKRERQFNFLVSSFSLSCSLVCLTFSCHNNFSTVPLFYTHTHMHIHMHKWGETDLCKFRSSYYAIQIFSCWKNFPVLHHCFKDSIKKTYTWFFGLIKSRFSEPEMFLIYTRVSKTTPAMVINFTDNDDIQRYSPFLSSCVCFLFEHSVLHNVGWPLPILPIMTHISIMGLEG